MLISIYMKKKHFIYINSFMITNIIILFILKKNKIEGILNTIIYDSCEICLI